MVECVWFKPKLVSPRYRFESDYQHLSLAGVVSCGQEVGFRIQNARHQWSSILPSVISSKYSSRIKIKYFVNKSY